MSKDAPFHGEHHSVQVIFFTSSDFFTNSESIQVPLVFLVYVIKDPPFHGEDHSVHVIFLSLLTFLQTVKVCKCGLL